MDIGLLGLLQVIDDGEPVVVGRGKESALLAILALHANTPVSSDRLIIDLWGDSAPRLALKSVQQYVARLRRSLGAERLTTTAGGYMLRLGRDELDVDRFERLAAEGRVALNAGEGQAAEGLFSSALKLWRGPALTDFRFEDFAQESIRRLEGERRTTIVDRVDALLALGQQEQAVLDLRRVIEEDPLWERPRGQLMLAFYRSGRQSEALELYRGTRSLFDRELGLEPSRELEQLERAMLNHDPSLMGPSTPGRARPKRRGAALLVAAGVVAIAAAAATTTLLALDSGGGRSNPLDGDEVAAFAASGGSGVSYTGVGTTPGNLAVGAGGVWVLNSDDRTITHIDPSTGRVVKTFATGGTPTDLAAGDGELWIGTATLQRSLIEPTGVHAAVSRVDPASTEVTGSAYLPAPIGVDAQTPGVSGIAVERRAVWVVDPDGSISRIAPATGALLDRIETIRASAIAAGDMGVWFLTTFRGSPAVATIDPRTNTVARVIPVETPALTGIAVGAGSVWATDAYEGVVWRIDPSSPPVSRTISLGFGVTQIVFGDGAIWAANVANGTVSRIDPDTDDVTVTKKLPGTPQGLAIGGGTAWVSLAGGTSAGTLPSTDCGPVESNVSKPDVLVASDLPLQGPSVAPTLAAAVLFVLRSHGFRAGRYTVGYQSCDDSTARSQSWDYFKCAANARDYASAERLVAVIGPYDSPCAQIEIPVTNRASLGTLALISPSNTSPGLTRAGPEEAAGEPGIYYPTGLRNYFRLTAPDDVQGAGDAVLARQLGLRRVDVLTDGEPYGDGLARGFRTAARHLGITVVLHATWAPAARSYAATVSAVARSRTTTVLLAGYGHGSGGLIRALRRRFGAKLTVITGDGFLTIPQTLAASGAAAAGMYVSVPVVVDQSSKTDDWRLVSAFDATQPAPVPLGTYLPEVLEAAEVIVDAIARSDGTRASVLHELSQTRESAGLLGDFSFDGNGDMTPAVLTILKITGGEGAPSLASADFRGAVIDRTIRVPVSLLAGSQPIR